MQMKKYEIPLTVKCQQLSTTSSIPVGHISTRLRQFLTSSFRDFVWTDTQMMLPKTVLTHSMCTRNDVFAAKKATKKTKPLKFKVGLGKVIRGVCAAPV